MNHYPNIRLIIREASIHDAKELRSVIHTCVEKTHGANYSPEEISIWKKGYSINAIEEFIKQKRQVFLLEFGGSICGTIQFDTECSEIKGFYVHPSYQFQGFGTILLKFILGQLRASGIQNIELSSNKFFKSFYEKFLFQVVRKEQVCWGGYEFEEYRLRKRLCP
ncbi:MAG: GNAT family N-acetyltransferase [Saprospiraceae bacterium]|jgi:GNAT superfamily N-acetyltransferase|nr:GNAT family N-acetyltransferase [Saprospiraceae bacterium]